ncbi:MAG TPA: SDR family NAD(P)-dependent oxidoreductase [Sorangium sp.]|uniref:SDR family NAD(P)-dependent oxidoreductase n=1 Tax=Sorangium sp. So ce1153 TaxID=3133333 RepID=UPI002C873558|nr:SDR family NAD(P)-dependent oxidoreductase [Sorangium sp.]
MNDHPALTPGRVAVVTGAASGIGLAAARRFARMGLKVCLADLDGPALHEAAAGVAAVAAGGKDDVRAVPTDVARLDDVQRLKQLAYEAFGEVAVLMNNAGVGGGGKPWQSYDRWRHLIEVNLWGVIHGVQAFTEAMLAQGTPGAIVNTGSKQGITTPPGDAAYNVSKAGVKVLTEQLAHELRNVAGSKITAHLLIPGYTYTGMTARGPEKPAEAWTADQVVDFMIDGMGSGNFYLLCPDNAVTREIDERRIQWAADDLIRNRPALSRWHPDHAEAFAEYMARAAKP